MKPLTFKTYTFGCRVNQAETSEIEKDLHKAGFQPVKDNQLADLIIINTCVVTQKAEKEIRQLARKIKRENPQTFLILCGCAVDFWQRKGFPKLLVDLYVKNKEKEKLIDLIPFKSNRDLTAKGIKPHKNKYQRSNRQIIKIQEGCDQFCSYCIVACLRGKPKSKKISQIIKETKEAEKKGIKEIILSGINLGLFGQNTNETIPQLLKALLKKTTISQISFGSIYPEVINNEFIKVYLQDQKSKQKRLKLFFHLPLQSGSEKILKLMNRQFSLKKFQSITEKLHQALPQALIATDVIVGFPGETEKEFQKTYQFLKKAPILKFHVFRFSPRKETLAEKMAKEWGRVDEKTKTQRAKILRELGEKKYQKFLNKVANKQAL
ncbi:MiaB/RimO family radical SAM methylthiotransferase [Candidatus Microgenomates bacterium]|nr:MiaB/RimO family radical SAM methylthiotransferase [Candidatus Microgenomates bacterium]